MIQANELRVGNLVTINETALHFDGAGKDETFCISEIKEEVVKFKGFHTSELYSGIEPIPLTEEWLLKFGFEKSKNPNKTPSWVWKKDQETWFYETWKNRDIFVNGFIRWMKDIQSVHQLQNLYFALTGTELTIK